MSEMTDLQVFMDRLEVSLHEKFMACDDAAITPCQILLYVLNSVADARLEVYGGISIPNTNGLKKLLAVLEAAKKVPLGDEHGHLQPWEDDLFDALQNMEFIPNQDDSVEEDDNSEVLYALQMATEHDERHQALALRTWLPRIQEWQKKSKLLDELVGPESILTKKSFKR